ncbi:phage transcriptional activator, RinA family [Virgibacillus subterraneus]|uniref:Phage transcriptional activator, RinA family n=1 Tax=Virgibacillus subterraneus TaxID=621109 RepID=A0A1H9EBM8_9BACI|nr:transcriptional regulator [Virgibacillus subterraneus]SEQ23121.1 phage transcriptional activator, RinA family [Virgibacillus subterraneus]
MNQATLKPKKITFKHAESEWYNYHHTLKEIAKLREGIKYPFDEDPEDPTIVKGANSVRTPGNPTQRIATRLTTSKQLTYLTEVAEAVEQVYNALPDDYKKLVQLRYWSKSKDLTWDSLALELNVSRRQAIYWRKEIIQATVEVLGWR